MSLQINPFNISAREWHVGCKDIGMQTMNTFPNTRQDLENLKQTTVDAAKDIGSTASVHAQKARAQMGELAGHAREEAIDQVNRAQGGFTEVVASARDYIAARPLASVGVVLGVGIVVGFTRRRFRN